MSQSSSGGASGDDPGGSTSTTAACGDAITGGKVASGAGRSTNTIKSGEDPATQLLPPCPAHGGPNPGNATGGGAAYGGVLGGAAGGVKLSAMIE